MREEVLISAHRGGGERAAAATWEAYEDSVKSGAEYVEFDIRRTRDFVLVVHHDAHAGKADGGRARRARPMVADLTYEQMCTLLGRTVPRVEEIMRFLADGRVKGHLDLKEAGYEHEVVELAQKTFGPGNFVITSMEGTSIETIKRDFPGVITALSLGRDRKEVPVYKWPLLRYQELRPQSRIQKYRPDWVAVNYRLAYLGVLNQCKKADAGAMVWTVDRPRLIDRFLLDERVRVLITNKPRLAVERRAKLAARNRDIR